MESSSFDTDQPQLLKETVLAYDIVAIAASAGGLKALIQVLSSLPVNFPVPILIVQHLSPKFPSQMAEILSRRTPLTVKQAQLGDRIKAGTVYIAPPDYHLLVNPDNSLTLTKSKLIHFVRPCADLLFESIAHSHHHKAIAVVLTGMGQDGIMGVQAIHRMGGKVIAQDEETSEYFSMPHTAIETGTVDYILPLLEIAPKLVSLVMG